MRKNRRTTITVVSLFSFVALCTSALAQCPNDWIKTDGIPGAGEPVQVNAVMSWDPDGAGPQASRLVAGGIFQHMTDRVANKIAVLNPETGRWEDVAGGVNFISVDKKAGETLVGGSVMSLAVYQDDLIVGGAISHAGDPTSIPVNNIARWDGTAWSTLGSGLNGFVNSITVHNGELIATGSFITTGPPEGGTTVNRIARWNGTSWLPLGPPGNAGMNGDVNNVIVYNGELIATGNFTTAGGVPANRIARWDGSQWQALEPIGLNAAGLGLTVLGSDLYASGNFTLAGGVPQTRGVARWDGANWHPVGGGALFAVRTVTTFNGEIIAGGAFNVVLNGQSVRGLARLDDSSQTWVVMGGGFDPSGAAARFAVHDFGSGDDLVVVGSFRMIGDRSARGIARWSQAAQAWDRLAPGFDWNPWRFTTYRGDLIAGGSFYSAGDVQARGVARFDGREWHALGTGVGNTAGNVVGTINAFAVYNDELYVGGHFFNSGGVPTLHIARWNGDTETWSDVGGGVGSFNGLGCAVTRVEALAVYNGDLIVGGCFTSAGGLPIDSIARWDGSQWHEMPGFVGTVISMAVFQDDLYVSVNSGLVGMQRWDGAQWHAVPGGANNYSMTVWDGRLVSGFSAPVAYDGNIWTPLPGYNPPPSNQAPIYAYAVFNGDLILGGGSFETATGVSGTNGLARFDGTSWHALVGDNGAPTFVSGMCVHNGELITNSTIKHPDGTFSHWSRWGPVCTPLPGDINGDGIVNVIDLLAAINAWGPCPPPPSPCAADIAPAPDGDGNVNVLDLLMVINNWG
jgi:hypothetical protein